MIDHIGFPVSDYARSKAFYAQALAPLGYGLVMEIEGAPIQSRAAAAGFGQPGKPDFWIGGEGGLEKPLHVAIVAADRASVDAGLRVSATGAWAVLPRGRQPSPAPRRHAVPDSAWPGPRELR